MTSSSSGGESVSNDKPRDVHLSPRYRLFRWSVNILFKLIYGFTVEGRENVPHNGPLVIVANHSQYLDPVFVCTAVPRRIQWMAKKEVFVFPFRSFFRFIGTFPVDRQGGGRTALRASLGYLSEGWALGIFPEGTHRTEGPDAGSDRQPKNGAIMLASRSGASILPVFISKAPTFASRLRGEKLKAYIGKPVNMDNTLRGREAYNEVSEGLLATIYGLPAENDGGEK